MYITLPKQLTTIGEYAFANCYHLSLITLPGTVSFINAGVFFGHTPDNIYFDGTKEQYESISISYYDNQSLKKAEKIFLKYGITILDKQGNQLSKKAQGKNETIDLSSIVIPSKNILKLYIDKNYTEEYNMDSYITQDLTLYADFIELNNLKISGVQRADIGQKNILQSVTFATDKAAKYLVCTVKYPEALQLTQISAKDFYVDEDMRETVDGYTYSYLTCTYKENGNMPMKKTLNPFDLTFDISENAEANAVLKIEILEDAVLSGDDSYTFDTITNNEITTNPILIQAMSIIGADEIDGAATYIVLFTPENATNKAVKWSVNDDTCCDCFGNRHTHSDKERHGSFKSCFNRRQ